MSEPIAGHRFSTKDDILPVCIEILDTVRDEEMVDIHRVEKYFEKDAWLSVLTVISGRLPAGNALIFQ